MMASERLSTMVTLGAQEIIVIFVLALVLFGSNLPELRKAITKFRRDRFLR